MCFSTKIRRSAISVAILLLPLPATGDWLVTSNGEVVETRGTWKVKGRSVIFTDANGTLRSLRLDEVDLEASQTATDNAAEATQPRAAAPSKSPEAARPRAMVLTDADIARAEVDRPAAEVVPQPAVVMYSTDWCGYCRKARQLLDELGVAFVEKDIEKSAEAKREHAAIARGRGVPVLDIGGTVIRGYSASAIRKAVAELSPPADSSEARESQASADG